jgi:MFS family permease
MTSGINPFRTLQRHRNFRLFWFGQTLSLMGTWMQSMAQGWLALELSNNAFLVGLVASAQSLPILVLSLPAGVLVDRTDKLRVVKVCQTLLGLEAGALWWLTWSNHVTIGWLVTMAAVNGAISAVEIPARQSLMIELVGRDDLRDAIALNSSGFNLARIVGPGVAALVIANLGIAWCFGVNALSYVTVLIGLFMITLPEWTPDEQRASAWQGMKEGVRYMSDTPTIAALMVIVTVYSIFGVPYLTLMPVVARDILHLGASGYGVLLACVGVGGVTGALSLASVGDRFPRRKLLFGASLAYALLLILFSLVRAPWLASSLLLAIGFTMIMNNALSNALLQHLVPDALRGRLMAAYSLVVVGLSQVVGSFLAGAVARAVGADWAIGTGGAIMLLYSWWAFSRQPSLRALT